MTRVQVGHAAEAGILCGLFGQKGEVFDVFGS